MERAIKEYNHLDKLIEQCTYHVPTLLAMVTQAQIDILETENLKKFQKHMDNMMHDIDQSCTVW